MYLTQSHENRKIHRKLCMYADEKFITGQLGEKNRFLLPLKRSELPGKV